MTLPERLHLFETLRRLQLRHWPVGSLWVDLRHPFGVARVYRDGSVELLA